MAVLAAKNINIRALSVADTADFGILRLIVDKVEEAKKVLKESGFTVGKTNVVAVEVPDRAGGLCQQKRRKCSAYFSLRRYGWCHRCPGKGSFHNPFQ